MTTELSAVDPDTTRRLLHQMLRIRRFEERCVELYSTWRIRGFLHLYIGEEAVATGVIDHLRSDDSVVATYREHGHGLARGLSMRSILAEMYGRQEGCSRGRGGSMHLFDAATNFYGGNAIVAAGLPVAVGLALAAKRTGSDALTACFFGEGAVAEGEFHESLNLATLWDLPVLFCCENNLYAMGTPLASSESDPDIALKASGYGMAAWPVDGMDVLAVHHAAARAIATVRAGEGPVLLELRTYRFRAHSMYDPERYRDSEEVQRWRERDPIDALVAHLRERDELDDDALGAMEAEVSAEIDDAVTYAEAGTLEPVEDLERFVYTEGSSAAIQPQVSR
ncbi:MAG: pyruvate dehydrogenase (acetyl-transferring) E1 component subunit alpha [Microthrixaceae bacterium]|nr:pyruvate dehydrogenase (acetyl-transferring) E1 component subunit alpha [Microthrixaceae bacterium]